MKKIKKLIILIIVIVLFAIFHCYTEWKFNNNPPKGITQRLVELVDKLSH